MNTPRPKFSLYVWFYFIAFFSLFSLLPIILTATLDRASASPVRWIACALWPLMIALSWVYADRRCSSDLMRFNDGLFWVTASMMTGWFYLSFIFVFPALLVAFAASIFIAAYGDITRAPNYSQAQWRRMVGFCYRNRMRQR